DRTLVLTRDYLLDVYRARSDREHQYDWAWHGFGPVHSANPVEATELGNNRGYRLMSNPRRMQTAEPCLQLTWQRERNVHGNIWLPAGAAAILADHTEGAGTGH